MPIVMSSDCDNEPIFDKNWSLIGRESRNSDVYHAKKTLFPILSECDEIAVSAFSLTVFAGCFRLYVDIYRAQFKCRILFILLFDM